MTHNCCFCKSKVEPNFKFCGVCGKLLKKTCKKCDITFEASFNFCGQCGNSLGKSSIDPNFKTTTSKKNDISQNFGIKVKVSILFGIDMSPVKQEQGGGSRRLYLYQTDNYNQILRKITELYFPKNSYTCLGHFKEYRINILDFKKQILSYYNFKNLSSYVEKHGLTLQVKPIFFLHLFLINNQNVVRPTVNIETISKDNQNYSEIGNTAKKIKKEPQDVEEIENPNSKLTMTKKPGNEKKITDSSSSSSSESDSENDKNKLPNQNIGYESLRQKNKLLNPLPKTLPKRDSSCSSVSSSSSTASFKRAKKLDKKFNRRILDLKNESCSINLEKNQNQQTLLPTPNKTPSIKANLVSDQFNKNNYSTNKKNDNVLLKDEKTKKIEEDVAIVNDQPQKFDKFKYDKNYKSYSDNHYYHDRYYSDKNRNYSDSSNYNKYKYTRNSGENDDKYRNSLGYKRPYSYNNHYSINYKYHDHKYDSYKLNKDYKKNS